MCCSVNNAASVSSGSCGDAAAHVPLGGGGAPCSVVQKFLSKAHEILTILLSQYR